VLVVLLNCGQQPKHDLPKHHALILLKLFNRVEYLQLMCSRECLILGLILREVFPFYLTLSIHPHSSGLYEGFHCNCPLSIVGPIKSGNQRGDVVVRRHVSIREALKVSAEHLRVPIK